MLAHFEQKHKIYWDFTNSYLLLIAGNFEKVFSIQRKNQWWTTFRLRFSQQIPEIGKDCVVCVNKKRNNNMIILMCWKGIALAAAEYDWTFKCISEKCRVLLNGLKENYYETNRGMSFSVFGSNGTSYKIDLPYFLN